MDYFGIGTSQREVWRDQVVHPHRITGSLREGVSPVSLLQLVRPDAKGDAIIWSFRAESSGRFVVENVPHGRYRVGVSALNGGRSVHSRPLDVGDGASDAIVGWPSL
jgi:hypothetical protein